MNTLVVGGSSGLGLAVAEHYAEVNEKVIVVGRTDPKKENIDFRPFELSQPELAPKIKTFVNELPKIDRLIYTAGFYQQGLLTDLSEDDIESMLDVGARSLIYFVRAILEKQNELHHLTVVTSSTQYKPQKLESVYSFIKAGAGHFANSMAEDGRIKQVYVLSPSGTKTPFWRNIKHPDYDNFLDPEWVSEQIVENAKGNYRYKFVKLYRNPKKVEIVEER